MNRIVASLILFCAISPVALQSASAVTIDWSPVGNPGNANDPADGDIITPGIQNSGAVPYAYNIGTYDVTNSQYGEFLNAKDPGGVNALGLYISSMAGTLGGIDFNAAGANGTKYTLISGRQNHPVNWVSWYDAIRFANWLNNGQGAGDTETGAYTLLGGGPTPSNADSIKRNVGARVFLPSENEWYKAAYYNPATSSYFLYPTSSNSIPTASGPTALANHANFNNVVGNLTDAGAYRGTKSPYGAFDLGGNVLQWNETLINVAPSFSVRGLRGSPFGGGSNLLQSSARLGTGIPSGKGGSIGFRVASIP
jgi:formylglycine-generating enzyme required for sulfatase activity